MSTVKKKTPMKSFGVKNPAIAHYLQKKGVYVIPNVRWGDERTYTTEVFPEPLAFMGFEKHSIHFFFE